MSGMRLGGTVRVTWPWIDDVIRTNVSSRPLCVHPVINTYKIIIVRVSPFMAFLEEDEEKFGG